MNSNEMLVIQVNIHMKSDKLEEFRRDVIRQKKDGVIVLPPYCHVLCAPKDMEIGWKQPDPEMNNGEPEPEKYVIKRVSWNNGAFYVLNVRPSYGRALLVDYTEYKMIALRFSETEAIELLKKLGNGYEMEEL